MAARLSPCSRTDFIRKLTDLGYEGPFAGAKHQIISAPGKANVIIPNPHRGQISIDLLSRILRDANIDRDDWIRA
ncbi:MAG: type II toxin-antitoxin system HicA family toxin [Candidatus Binataceae bacterium]